MAPKRVSAADLAALAAEAATATATAADDGGATAPVDAAPTATATATASPPKAEAKANGVHSPAAGPTASAGAGVPPRVSPRVSASSLFAARAAALANVANNAAAAAAANAAASAGATSSPPQTKMLGDAKGLGRSGGLSGLGKLAKQPSGALLSPLKKLPTKEEYFAKMEAALRNLLTPFNSVFELEDAFWALNEYARHLIERGDDERVRTINAHNLHFRDRCAKLRGMPEMLDALGYRPVPPAPSAAASTAAASTNANASSATASSAAAAAAAGPTSYQFDVGLLTAAQNMSEAARAAALAAAAAARSARDAAGIEDGDADDEAARAAARTYAAGALVPLPAFCSALSLFRRLLVIEADALSKRVAELPVRLTADHEYSACHSVGQASDQGPRREMEDEEVVAEPFYAGNGQDAKEQRAAYFGLYDGHGGRQAVEFVVRALHVNFESIVARNPDVNPADLFREAYLTTDGQLRRRAIFESGCTSISVYLRHMPLPSTAAAAGTGAGAGAAGTSAAALAAAAAAAAAANGANGNGTSNGNGNGLLAVPAAATDEKKRRGHTRGSSSFGGWGAGVGSGPSVRRLYVANAGDARVILVRAGGRAERLSYDHKPDLAEETERIEADGGEVRGKRVAGCLAVSRALGDHRGFKDEHDWVSAEPFVRELTVRDDDLYVVLACDGVWDVMDDDEVAEFVSAKVKAAELENEHLSATNPAERKLPNALMDGVARALVARALEKESSDNVTAMIVRL